MRLLVAAETRFGLAAELTLVGEGHLRPSLGTTAEGLNVRRGLRLAGQVSARGLGFALARLERMLALAPTRRRLALAAVVFMPLLLRVRNDFDGFPPSVVWGTCMVLLLAAAVLETLANVSEARRRARPGRESLAIHERALSTPSLRGAAATCSGQRHAV